MYFSQPNWILIVHFNCMRVCHLGLHGEYSRGEELSLHIIQKYILICALYISYQAILIYLVYTEEFMDRSTVPYWYI